MQEKHLYEYAVIRVVPNVEREEFINVGIILFCKRQRFLSTLLALDAQKLLMLSPEVDLIQIENNLISFQKICLGSQLGGRIAELEIAERFRWLTAVRSSVIQTSRPHPGLSENLENTTRRLLRELVN